MLPSTRPPCSGQRSDGLARTVTCATAPTPGCSCSEAGPQRALDIDAVETALARELESRGWKVDLHVGRSRDFRISLALADRATPERWRLGVELDGVFHRAAPTVIDRESVREGVLGGLGWRTMRVSAIDALRDLAGTVARIDAAARAAD